MLILGLDVSTACTGWAIIDESGDFVDIGSIELSKEPGLYSKASYVRSALNDVLIRHPVNQVYIEENLQSFRRGFSSAQTLSTLARFNGIVSLISYEVFSVEPVHINVNAARKSLGIKLISKKKGGEPTKQQVMNWVSSKLEDTSLEWPIKILKSGPRKGQSILDPSCYDMADAYVIAKAGQISAHSNG